MKFIRSLKRRAGADWRSHDPQDRAPGPWHVVSPGLGSSLSWCGVRVAVFAHETASGNTPPDGRPVCRNCRRALDEGRPRPFKGRRRI